LVKQEDLPFIREFGVANLMEKPFEKQNFTKALIWTIQQERVPTEVAMMERKMRNLLRFDERKEAQQIRPRFNSHPNVNIGKRQMIDAEFAFFDKDYTKTRDLCLMAIKNHGDNLLLFSLLGRAMMHLREFDYALKCFERAKSMVPQNIERLCQIAEIKSEIGDHSTATKLLDGAKGIDISSEFIKESEAKVALNSGDPARAKIIMNHVRAVENVVSYMNNQAVAMARCNMIEESILRYRQTILAIPDNRPDIKASVLYNLGLAMVRSEKLTEAILPLEEATKLTNPSVKRKARSLLRRVRKAISSNSGVTILSAKEDENPKYQAAQDANKEELTEEDSSRNLLGIVDLMPGDFACYQIFKPLIIDEKYVEMQIKIPHFKIRKTIKRDSTGGVERMMQQNSKAG
jgi:tetratricopeptide (TPR) repeat protein